MFFFLSSRPRQVPAARLWRFKRGSPPTMPHPWATAHHITRTVRSPATDAEEGSWEARRRSGKEYFHKACHLSDADATIGCWRCRNIWGGLPFGYGSLLNTYAASRRPAGRHKEGVRGVHNLNLALLDTCTLIDSNNPE